MIKALGKRIIVQEVDLQEKPQGFLILPSKKDHITAIVRAIGNEVDDCLDLYDVVYLLPDTGIEVEINGEKLLSVVENQIIAAWKDK